MTEQKLKLRSWYRGTLGSGRRTPLELVMIQATPFCNINCDYCYLPNRDSTKRFNIKLLRPLLKKLESSGLLPPELTFLWHAGEPTALPTSYYREAFEEIARHAPPDCQISHHMQTNATLLDDEYCQFIQEKGIKIGVSVDGPELIHNRFRVDRKKKGTFRQTMAGIEKLTAHKIPFSVISVLTDFSLDYPDEIYEFLESIGVRYVGFNIDEAEGGYQTSSLDSQESQQRYLRFMRRIYTRNKQSKHPIEFREIQTGFNAIAGDFHSQESHSTENNPLSILSLDVEGNVSTFSPELIDNEDKDGNKFQFGNISDIDFTKIYEHPVFHQMNIDIQQGIARCRKECRYFDLCGGGTPSNKYYENGSFDSTETNYCIYRVKLITDLVAELIHEARLWRIHGSNE